MNIIAPFFVILVAVSAFSATPMKNLPDKPTTNNLAQDFHRMNFHQVLQRVGKTVLRPGGSPATSVLHEWANLKPDDTVLELSSGLGTGGMALAQRFGCRVILTDKDTDRLVLAEQVAEKKGLANHITTRTLDMHQLDAMDATDYLDAVVVEASLTHDPLILKQKVLNDLMPHTKQILLHEVALNNDCDPGIIQEIERNMGTALAIGFHPITIDAWRALLNESGYEITHLEQGPLRLLEPISILQDEGPVGMAKIAWNLAVHSHLRERVLLTRALMQRYKDRMGYVILRAVPRQG